MKQLMLTPAAGKRLIGKAIAVHPAVKNALKKGTVVIIAGTTNAYVAEEINAVLGGKGKFTRSRFFRGVNLPPNYTTTESGRLSDESKFPGDVVITNGVFKQGQTIYDVADNLKEGDVILKGANAVDPVRQQAAIILGNPQGGTVGVALKAVKERGARLILPVGLEKRANVSLEEIARKINAPGVKGYRLMPVSGEIVTEIEALKLLTGVEAELFAGGGICGAEGCIWLGVSGTPEQEESAEKLVKAVAGEPAYTI